MTDDLKERMKSKTCDGGYYADWWQEALDRIEQQDAEQKLLMEINERLMAALRSIAANTCCDTCQEAALVARAALAGEKKDG